MDPASITMIIATIASIGGQIVDGILAPIKAKQNVKAREAARVISDALQKVYSKSQALGDKLTNRLNSLQIVQRTPALQEAIDKSVDNIEDARQKLQELTDNAVSTAQAKADQVTGAQDESIWTRGKSIDNAKKEAQKYAKQIETDLASRFEQTVL